MKNVYQAIKSAVLAGIFCAFSEYRFIRHMQKGGNPDILPF